MEILTRPPELDGKTYKIKTPLAEQAFYVTINNISVNGKLQPFEIFINSKNMDNFAWIVALTRVLSAVFRHRESVFLVDELRSVFDPKGGYWKPGGKYMPSLVAEIGECIERHLISIGAVTVADITPEMVAKRKEAQGRGVKGTSCPKCGQMALVSMDGCGTCIDCGYSKCG